MCSDYTECSVTHHIGPKSRKNNIVQYIYKPTCPANVLLMYCITIALHVMYSICTCIANDWGHKFVSGTKILGSCLFISSLAKVPESLSALLLSHDKGASLQRITWLIHPLFSTAEINTVSKWQKQFGKIFQIFCILTPACPALHGSSGIIQRGAIFFFGKDHSFQRLLFWETKEKVIIWTFFPLIPIFLGL